MAEEQAAAISRSLAGIRGFVFDLDGTVWEGRTLVPGITELITDLRHERLGVVFASNSSRHGGASICKQLGELGIEAKVSEVFTPFDLVGQDIKQRLGPIPVLPIGTDDLARVLVASGHTSVPTENWRDAKAVVVGVDYDFSYDRLRAAARAVAAGAQFVAINLDSHFPIGQGLFDPGCGALAEAIATASGVRPISIGKPEPTLFRYAIEGLGCSPETAAMVGDSTASDIRGGKGAGMFTIWLAPQGDRTNVEEADLKVYSLAELHERWRKARAEYRGNTNSPLP